MRKNLSNSFPEKDKKYLKNIELKYYHHLCDLVIENIWSMRVGKNKLQKHLVFSNIGSVKDMYQNKKDIIILLGHTGNWEWSNLSFSTLGLHQLWALYRPLKNKPFDNFFIKIRSRLGARLVPMQQVYRTINEPHDKPAAICFIADQSPVPEYAFWTKFLNQDTCFFNGFEKIAIKKNYPVYFAHFKKMKRGYYEVQFELLAENPADLTENELTQLFVNSLEKLILEAPENWLWSHKRWKHKRPD